MDMAKLLPIIGLEIHVRLKTKSKMFCGCANVQDDQPPNAVVCPICTGQPGALPAVNEEAVRVGVRAGLILGCNIPDQAFFDRKNYFYPDLPKGYQISQFDKPIAEGGEVWINVPNAEPPRDSVRIRITRAHLEEDAAKNIHSGKTGKTLVDFNRAGQPLLEIVTEPDIRTPEEAKIFLQELQAMLRAGGISDADMEKGFMRCDANISLLEVDEENQPTKAGYNPKTEVKNLNSFRAVERALAFEITRQKNIFADGGVPEHETRGWNENKQETFSQRSKESSADYRYFREPDLSPLDLVRIREEEKPRLPEMPAETRARLAREWSFTEEDAAFIVANGWTDFAEQVMGELGGWIQATSDRTIDQKKQAFGKLAGSWLTNKLAGLLKQKEKGIDEVNITPENFAEFLHLVHEGAVNSANAQKLLLLMHEEGKDPSHVLEEHNLGQMNDADALSDIVARVIEQNPEQAEEAKSGKVNVIKWFVGGVMKATEGRANPVAAEDEIKKQLGA